MSTFTPVSPLPLAGVFRSIFISPPHDDLGNSNIDEAPGLRFDAQGKLWAGFAGDFTEMYTDEGNYCGPRPVIEVVHVHSLDMVVVVTDEITFLMGSAEYNSQV